MLGSGNNLLAPATANVPNDRDAHFYDRHASGLYRQALLTLDDAHLAEQVVCDVLVDECVQPRASEGDEENVGYRLAVSAYQRCRELADGPGVAGPPA